MCAINLTDTAPYAYNPDSGDPSIGTFYVHPEWQYRALLVPIFAYIGLSRRLGDERRLLTPCLDYLSGRPGLAQRVWGGRSLCLKSVLVRRSSDQEIPASGSHSLLLAKSSPLNQ